MMSSGRISIIKQKQEPEEGAGGLEHLLLLPILLSDSEPQRLLFSHITALPRPSHPIKDAAGLLKRAGRP